MPRTGNNIIRQGPVNTNLGLGLVNTNWEPGPVYINWRPGSVNTNWEPGPVNTNWEPGPGPGAGKYKSQSFKGIVQCFRKLKVFKCKIAL